MHCCFFCDDWGIDGGVGVDKTCCVNNHIQSIKKRAYTHNKSIERQCSFIVNKCFQQFFLVFLAGFVELVFTSVLLLFCLL